jgi:type IV fimbrial biogenesis protein FimT
MDSAAGECGSTNMADAAAPSAPRVIQRRAGNDGSRNAQVNAGLSSVTFNSLGRVTPVPAGNIAINVSNPSAGTCEADGGTVRCLRIVVSPAGQVRMCDPNTTSPDPRAC